MIDGGGPRAQNVRCGWIESLCRRGPEMIRSGRSLHISVGSTGPLHPKSF